MLIAVGLPAVAFPLYARLGQPMLPDEPLASRKVTPQTDGGIEAAVAAVEARLTAKPDDGKGWAVIAPVYMRLERYADAAHAYAEALRILGEDRCAAPLTARLWSPPPEASSPTRRGKRSIGRLPISPASRRRAIISRSPPSRMARRPTRSGTTNRCSPNSPPDAPWRSYGERAFGGAQRRARRPRRTAAIPEAQRPMIEGMVSKLATRLASSGGGVDEWSRLIRAYTVLHEADKAKAALVDAHKALAQTPTRSPSLDALAHDLGLGDAN